MHIGGERGCVDISLTLGQDALLHRTTRRNLQVGADGRLTSQARVSPRGISHVGVFISAGTLDFCPATDAMYVEGACCRLVHRINPFLLR